MYRNNNTLRSGFSRRSYPKQRQEQSFMQRSFSNTRNHVMNNISVVGPNVRPNPYLRPGILRPTMQHSVSRIQPFSTNAQYVDCEDTSRQYANNIESTTYRHSVDPWLKNPYENCVQDFPLRNTNLREFQRNYLHENSNQGGPRNFSWQGPMPGKFPQKFVESRRNQFNSENTCGQDIVSGRNQNNVSKGNFKRYRTKNYPDRTMSTEIVQKNYEPSKSQNKRFGSNLKKDNTGESVAKVVLQNKQPVDNLRKKAMHNAKNSEVSVTDGKSIANSTPRTHVPLIHYKKEVETEKSNLFSTKLYQKEVSTPRVVPLFCHICVKILWDRQAFEKHLQSRDHELVNEFMNRKYELKAAFLRKECEMFEKQRQNILFSSLDLSELEFCTMCNLKFLPPIGRHKSSEGHQRLKNFIHPYCRVCSLCFANRSEFDDHRLSVEHLQKLNELRRQEFPDIDDNSIYLMDVVEDLNDEIEIPGFDLKPVGFINEEVSIDSKDPMLYIHNPNIPVGEKVIIDRTAPYCKVCNRFIISKEYIQIHCRSKLHFDRYKKFQKLLLCGNRFYNKRIVEEESTQKSVDEYSGVKRMKLSSNPDSNCMFSVRAFPNTKELDYVRTAKSINTVQFVNSSKTLKESSEEKVDIDGDDGEVIIVNDDEDYLLNEEEEIFDKKVDNQQVFTNNNVGGENYSADCLFDEFPCKPEISVNVGDVSKVENTRLDQEREQLEQFVETVNSSEDKSKRQPRARRGRRFK